MHIAERAVQRNNHRQQKLNLCIEYFKTKTGRKSISPILFNYIKSNVHRRRLSIKLHYTDHF